MNVIFQESEDEGGSCDVERKDDIVIKENDLQKAIEESPILYPGSSCTLFETLIHLFDWFSSHPSIGKEAFSKNLEL